MLAIQIREWQRCAGSAILVTDWEVITTAGRSFQIVDTGKRAENYQMKWFGDVSQIWHVACFINPVEHQSGRIPPGHIHAK
jgi:hypothetical protein